MSDDGAAALDAAELKRALERPIFNRIVQRTIGAGETDYERYLATERLYALQTPREQLSHDDELMFQIVHQAQELWLKLLAHEAACLVAELETGSAWQASARLERMVRIQRVAAQEIGVLETLTPATFLVIRRNLGSGSGQESPGYNRLLLAAGGVEGAFARWLEGHGVAVLDVLRDPGRLPAAARLIEQLVDLDQAHQLWLIEHFMLVRRTIGVHREIPALDGVPTTVLVGRMTKPLFRDLWEARVALTKEWRREGGHAPGVDREHGGNGAAARPEPR